MKEYKKEMKRYTERNPSEKDKFRDMFEYEEAKYTKHYTDQTHRTSGLRSWDDLLFSVSGIQSEGSYPRREDSGSRLCQGSSPRQRTRHLKSNFDFSNNSTFRKATGFKKKTAEKSTKGINGVQIPRSKSVPEKKHKKTQDDRIEDFWNEIVNAYELECSESGNETWFEKYMKCNRCIIDSGATDHNICFEMF